MLVFRIYLLLSLYSFAESTIAPTHLFVNRIGPCYDTPKTSVSISELSITRKIYDFTLSGQVNITANISNGWDIKATMQKCMDIRNLDTCDHFKSFTVIRGGCTDGVGSEGFDLYSMFFHYSNPKMGCPLTANNYIIQNFPYFTEDNYLAVSETKISTSVFGYTFRLEGFSEDVRFMCAEAYLRLLYIREHNWLGIDTAFMDETTAQSASEDQNDEDEE